MSRHFFSEWHQDWAVASIMRLTHGLRRGSGGLTYVDLAANEPELGSNSFFFDACLGWRGVCVEPHPVYHHHIGQVRSCALEPVCVSNNVDEPIEFVLDRKPERSHVEPLRARALASGRAPCGRAPMARAPSRLRMHCVRLATLLARHNLSHVHYLSLDVEGSELPALQSVDWSRTTVDLLTVENTDQRVTDFLRLRGLVPTLCLAMDTLFVRAPLAWGAAQWYARHARHSFPACVTNRTDQCLTGGLDQSKPNYAYLACDEAHQRGEGMR